jgi:hypothetical protein
MKYQVYILMYSKYSNSWIIYDTYKTTRSAYDALRDIKKHDEGYKFKVGYKPDKIKCIL